MTFIPLNVSFSEEIFEEHLRWEFWIRGILTTFGGSAPPNLIQPNPASSNLSSKQLTHAHHPKTAGIMHEIYTKYS